MKPSSRPSRPRKKPLTAPVPTEAALEPSLAASEADRAKPPKPARIATKATATIGVAQATVAKSSRPKSVTARKTKAIPAQSETEVTLTPPAASDLPSPPTPTPKPAPARSGRTSPVKTPLKRGTASTPRRRPVEPAVASTAAPGAKSARPLRKAPAKRTPRRTPSSSIVPAASDPPLRVEAVPASIPATPVIPESPLPPALAPIPAPLSLLPSLLEEPVFAPHVPMPLGPRSLATLSTPPIPDILLSGDYPDPTLWITPTAAPADPLPAAVSHPPESSAPPRHEVPEEALATPPPSHEPAPAPPAEQIPRRVAVWLDARDPFSLFAQWEADEEVLRRLLAHRPTESLRLRVFARSHGGALMADQVVTPSVRQRLVPVLYSNTPYWAELGWVDTAGVWKSLAISAPLSTPPDSHRPDWSRKRGRFVPSTAGHRPAPVTDHSPRPPAPTPRSDANYEDPAPGSPQSDLEETETAEQLTALVWEPTPVVVSAGNSATVHQWVAQLVTTARVVPPGVPPSPASPEHALLPTRPSAVEQPPSSPAVPTPPLPSDFWFKINAELILYGSTEPDATVTIAGRPVKLRDDGSFTFRFSLPDGQFDLPAQAVKADGSAQRRASLTFRRATQLGDDVGVHPQDPSLSPPVAEAIR